MREEIQKFCDHFAKYDLVSKCDLNHNTLYQDFTIDEVEAQYTVSGAFQTETELLIRNY